MGFEISIVSNTPLTPIEDQREVAAIFLAQIGYLPKGYDPKNGAQSIDESVPFRLFVDCFLARPEKPWLIEELAIELETTKPTIYRHINKLKAMDLVESMPVGNSKRSTPKKGYRLRYGDLAKAWNLVEANVEVALQNYRKTVEHLGELSKKPDPKKTAKTRGKRPKKSTKKRRKK